MKSKYMLYLYKIKNQQKVLNNCANLRKMKNYLCLLILLVSSTLSAQLVLNEVFFAVGNTLKNDANRDGSVVGLSDDEFVEFVNTSNAPLDISGYKIYNSISFKKLPVTDVPEHKVANGTIIPAGGIYVVFGGGDLSKIRKDFNKTIFHKASTGAFSFNNINDQVQVLKSGDTNKSNALISFDARKKFLAVNFFQSMVRSPNITGDFVRHWEVANSYFSPGELKKTTYRQTLGLVINEVYFDAKGDANGDGIISENDDEFIEMINNTEANIDISGYKIYDNRNFRKSLAPRHIVPAKTIIPSGGVYLLFGGGNPTGDFGKNTITQKASSGTLNLFNSGESIFITDKANTVVAVLATIKVNAARKQSVTKSPDITGDFRLHKATYLQLNFSPGKQANGDDFNVKKNTYVVGESYFGANNYIEYIPGDLPIIIVAPHGGPIKPIDVEPSNPQRGNDAGTYETTQLLKTNITNKTKGGTPHVIYNNLYTKYLNPVSPIDKAAGEQSVFRKAYKEFHDFIEDAKAKVTNQWGKGHYIEIHGNGVNQTKWNMIGLGVSKKYLQGSDDDIRSRLNVSSVKNLIINGKADFIEIVKGKSSLAGLLDAKGWKSAPTVSNIPGEETFFYSGYNIHKHGSRHGGTIDATHLETYYAFMQKRNRDKYANDVAESLLTFMDLHYGFNLRNKRFP